MSKQVLTIEQMRHLQELGLQLKETMIYWAKPKVATDATWVLNIGNVRFGTYWETWEYIPAYTLQDILDVLLTEIVTGDRVNSWDYHTLEIGVHNIDILYISYGSLHYVHNKEIIDAAYELLCWVIENGYVETNKTNK